MGHETIHIEGARQHNLKNVSLDIPRDQLVVVCGPSGSGKSTLAFDIVYAEGQRRYVESLSAYARQFLPQLDKPQVDKIEGLSPAISLEQQSLSRNPRSTVGTVTEIYDFLRVFYARLGTFHCPQCGEPISAQTADEIVDAILALPEGTRFLLLAPLVEHQKGTHKDLFAKLKKEGFARVRVAGEVHTLDAPPELDKNKKHTVELVVDRLVSSAKPETRKRLADSVELGLRFGQGRVTVAEVGGPEQPMSTLSACAKCRISLPKLTPQLFSFNSPQGACPVCSGLGSVEYFEPDLLAPNKGLSLESGAILPWKNREAFERFRPTLKNLGARHGFSLAHPFGRVEPQGQAGRSFRAIRSSAGRAWSTCWRPDCPTAPSGATSWPASARPGPARSVAARGSSPRRCPCAWAASPSTISPPCPSSAPFPGSRDSLSPASRWSSPSRCSKSWATAWASWSTSGWTTFRWRARCPRCPAARPSASAWPASLARAWSA